MGRRRRRAVDCAAVVYAPARAARAVVAGIRCDANERRCSEPRVGSGARRAGIHDGPCTRRARGRAARRDRPLFRRFRPRRAAARIRDRCRRRATYDGRALEHEWPFGRAAEQPAHDRRAAVCQHHALAQGLARNRRDHRFRRRCRHGVRNRGVGIRSRADRRKSSIATRVAVAAGLTAAARRRGYPLADCRGFDLSSRRVDRRAEGRRNRRHRIVGWRCSRWRLRRWHSSIVVRRCVLRRRHAQ